MREPRLGIDVIVEYAEYNQLKTDRNKLLIVAKNALQLLKVMGCEETSKVIAETVSEVEKHF